MESSQTKTETPWLLYLVYLLFVVPGAVVSVLRVCGVHVHFVLPQ